MTHNLFRNLTMYQAMLYFLRALIGAAIVLSLLGLLPYTWWHIAANLALLIIFCVAANKLFSLIFKIKTNYESQYITAEILTLIVGPLSPLVPWNIAVLAAVAVFSQLSKYIINIQGRHVFNPAAFGILASALMLGHGASWWVGHAFMLPFVLAGGWLLARKLRWLYFIAAFLIAFIILLAANSLLSPVQINIFELVKNVLLNSAIIFFVFVMLIEPLTAPKGRKLKIYYAIFIAASFLAMQRLVPNYAYGLETSLLIGNLAAFLISRNPKNALILWQKEQLVANTTAFWFTPAKPFQFKPGQFLEWTLDHAKADNRGIKRWFTIASSPTEKNLLLATRLTDKSSTFKSTLNHLGLGDQIVAAGLDGDFVLPADHSIKLGFVAGGIGITPFRSMIKFLLDTNQKRDIILFYSNKTAQEIAFKDLLNQALQIGVTTIYIQTSETGYLDEERIKKEAPDYLERTFYVSGPEPMVESYEKKLKSMGVKKIMTDFFPGYGLD